MVKKMNRKTMGYVIKCISETFTSIVVCIAVIYFCMGGALADQTSTIENMDYVQEGSESLMLTYEDLNKSKQYAQIFSRLPEGHASLYLSWGAVCYTWKDENYKSLNEHNTLSIRYTSVPVLF